MSDLFDLSGKTAIVTGSTKGIGKAIARAMGKHGARVVISSRDADRVKATSEELSGGGLEVLGIVKPPFYVPLPDRVSGTGGRMFNA